MDVVTSLTRAATFAACSGFRAFSPLFIISLVFRLNIMDARMLNPSVIPFMVNNDAMFYALAILAVFEIIAEKISFLGQLLDVIQMALRPLAGALAGYCFLTFQDNILNIVVAGLLGLILALYFHNLKTNTHMVSRAEKHARFNLDLSLIADLESLGGSLMGLFFPGISFLAVPIIFYGTMEGFKRWKIRIIAGEEIDQEVTREMMSDDEVLEIKKLRKLHKKKKR